MSKVTSRATTLNQDSGTPNLNSDTRAFIAISEIFGPTIQGEGALIGVPTVFVRTGGCDFRCSWCDTLYAVEPRFKADWAQMSAQAVMAEIIRLSGNQPLLVTLSGGNPALQPLGELVQLGQQQGYTFAIETQGSKAQPWFGLLDHLTLSPKPPSSGMAFNRARFAECLTAAGKRTQISLKLVISDDADYQWAKEFAARYPQLSLTLQPCNLAPATPEQPDMETDIESLNARLRWLVDKVTADRWFNARVLPQLHVLIWNNERGFKA
ncbi:7-carboxy-7-deazaguanine synthase QueE [Oceanisphaera profunda]|uniref:7-carboxy-7-deazaguanine synthase n=1 Tax=Oceanisphaera profunda TaxID=1416627 RepID=A0A1Y0D1P3_9GAMM|nr:7-carboxy-7-deazaguanine synthase QueE [Oceanisphaera profunda]ART81449.1 7-carboxy-7-deazaguanine synthase QueE [Oceanisphaera profunda]